MHIIAWLSPAYIVRNTKTWDDYSKIQELIWYWAKEFFVGYVPDYWFQEFWFELSPNWRQSASYQIQSKEHLQDLVNYIHSQGCEIMLTVNANSFNETVWEKVKQIIQDWIDLNIDWFVISDLWVLEYLYQIWYNWKINVSTIFNIYNNYTISFLSENYNINRYILPRELSVKEIQTITSNFPDLRFEVFLSGDKCIWNNWFCFTEHNTKWNPHSYCQFIEKIYDYRKVVQYDFKKIINNKKIDSKEQLEKMSNQLGDLPYWYLGSVGEYLLSNTVSSKSLYSYYSFFKNKINLIYDPTYPYNHSYNQNIIKFVNWLRHNIEKIQLEDNDNNQIYDELEDFIKMKYKEISYWIKHYQEKIEDEWIDFVNKVDTTEWNRSWMDVIEYFKQIPNIDALKVASRWKDLKMIHDYITGIWNKEFWLKKFIEENNKNQKFSYYNHPENKLL